MVVAELTVPMSFDRENAVSESKKLEGLRYGTSNRQRSWGVKALKHKWIFSELQFYFQIGVGWGYIFITGRAVHCEMCKAYKHA